MLAWLLPLVLSFVTLPLAVDAGRELPSNWQQIALDTPDAAYSNFTAAQLEARSSVSTTQETCANVAGSWGSLSWNFGCLCLSDVDGYCDDNNIDDNINKLIKYYVSNTHLSLPFTALNSRSLTTDPPSPTRPTHSPPVTARVATHVAPTRARAAPVFLRLPRSPPALPATATTTAAAAREARPTRTENAADLPVAPGPAAPASPPTAQAVTPRTVSAAPPEPPLATSAAPPSAAPLVNPSRTANVSAPPASRSARPTPPSVSALALAALRTLAALAFAPTRP